MKYLTDPRFFNVLIVFLFACAATRWAFAGSLKQTLYWGGACALNFAVVFMKD